MGYHEAMAEEARERIARQEALYPDEGPLRQATPEEVEALRREIEARYFPAARGWEPWMGPNYTVQRTMGAAGD